MPHHRATISVSALLDAGEAVVLRDGVGGMTLEAVAAKAKVSKGGLLHHFPSKHELIAAMVTRIVDDWNRRVDGALAAAGTGPGRLTRTMVAVCMDDPDAWHEQMRRRSLVLITALIADPSLVRPLTKMCKKQEMMLSSDGLPSGVGELVSAALDGIWMGWVLGMREINTTELVAIRRRMLDLVAASVDAKPAKKARAATKRPRSRV